MRDRRGFTLIELLVVIAIIGALSGIVLVSLNKARDLAKISKAKQEVNTLYNALLAYSLETGDYPVCGINSSNFENISSDPPNGWNTSWRIGYVNQEIGNDPWGTSYYYDGCPRVGFECAAGHSSVCSAGPDRAFESFNESDMVANDDDICKYFPPEC